MLGLYTASLSVRAREEQGGGTWVELSADADPIYQTILIAAEKVFWQSVKNGEPPALFDCEPRNRGSKQSGFESSGWALASAEKR